MRLLRSLFGMACAAVVITLSMPAGFVDLAWGADAAPAIAMADAPTLASVPDLVARAIVVTFTEFTLLVLAVAVSASLVVDAIRRGIGMLRQHHAESAPYTDAWRLHDPGG